MAELWYYTSEGKQMEPVTASDLKQLAATGLLKPTDMVWKEGMPKWIRASSAQGLFDSAGAETVAYDDSTRRSQSKVAALLSREEGDRKTDDRPRRERRRNPDRREDDDDDDDRPRRRRRAQDEGMSTGLKVGLILGGSLVVIGLVVGAIILLANSGNDPMPVAQVNFGKGQPFNVPANLPANINVPPVVNNNPQHIGGGKEVAGYSENLASNEKRFKTQFFKANTRYELTARSDRDDREFDFAIVDGNGVDLEYAENQGRIAEIVFNPRNSGNYRVEVHNLSGQPNRVQVTIREVRAEAAVQAQPVAPVFPKIKAKPPVVGPRAPVFRGPLAIGPGGYVDSNRITLADPREASERGLKLCKVYSFQMVAGKTYTIRNDSQQFDAYLIVQDMNHGSLLENDDFNGLNSQIDFNPPQTGNYRVVVTSLNGGETGSYIFRVNEKR